MSNEFPVDQESDGAVPVVGLRLLVSVEEAAVALGISRTAVFRLLREGRIRSVKIDKRRLIAVTALHDFVSELPQAS